MENVTLGLLYTDLINSAYHTRRVSAHRYRDGACRLVSYHTVSDLDGVDVVTTTIDDVLVVGIFKHGVLDHILIYDGVGVFLHAG